MMYEVWIDGACEGNPGPMGAGLVIKDGEKTRECSFFLGTGTNNLAEYSALFIAVSELTKIKAKEAKIFSDSELLVKQVSGEYKIKSLKLKRLADLIKGRWSAGWRLIWIPREKNRIADKLARRAITLWREVHVGYR